tara:strand:+ start:587 stop:859 length:273 start_codon:yes stop_codon:yes gene_type:complete
LREIHHAHVSSHIWVIGATTTLWHNPIYILAGVLDIASLAVYAVLGIDLKLRRTFLNPYDFVNSSRTITLFGSIKLRKIETNRNPVVLEA